MRVLVTEEGSARSVPGLLGSLAVGTVRRDAGASFGDHEVRRALVVGGGLRPAPAEVPAGGGLLRFESHSVPGEEPDAPLLGIQELMRRAESLLAARLAISAGDLVLADGPLTYAGPTVSHVVGVIKRTVRRYLPPECEGLLGALGPGERTPLFAIGGQAGPRRLSWYCRLVPLRPPWHDRAGIVRCELWSGVGPAAAASVADRVASLLPRFAGRPSDPRAPQNLAPVGALEEWLRHRLGHPALIRRAITRWLMTGGG